MGMDTLGRYAEHVTNNPQADWDCVKSEARIKGHDLSEALHSFAKEFAAHPTLAGYNQAHFFSRQIPSIQSGISGRVDELADQIKTPTGVLDRMATGARATLKTKKEEDLVKIAQAHTTLLETMENLKPSSWGIDHLGSGDVLTSAVDLSVAVGKGQTARDLDGRGKYFLWDPSTQNWRSLEAKESVIRGELDRLVSNKDELQSALIAATQNTLNAASMEMVGSGQALGSVDYTVFFAIEDGRIQMRMEGQARATRIGEREEGSSVHLGALYDPRLSPTQVHLRVSSSTR